MGEVKEKILALDEDQFTVYQFNHSDLKAKTVEVVSQHILEHYDGQIYGVGELRFIAFNNKDINQDLLDLLHDLSFRYVSKENLQSELKNLKS